ncbi:hypothetical protein ACFL6C_09915, partial [Myxococcota bacterium]
LTVVVAGFQLDGRCACSSHRRVVWLENAQNNSVQNRWTTAPRSNGRLTITGVACTAINRNQ